MTYDPSEFFRLAWAERRHLLTRAFRILHDWASAEEVTQEVYLDILRKPSYDPGRGKSLRNWLIMVTLANCRDRLRRNQARRLDRQVDIDLAAELPDKTQDVEESVASMSEVRRVFQDLPPQQRQTLMLVVIQGYSFEQVAQELGVSFCTVRHHYYRGLERLRRTMFAEAKLQK